MRHKVFTNRSTTSTARTSKASKSSTATTSAGSGETLIVSYNSQLHLAYTCSYMYKKLSQIQAIQKELTALKEKMTHVETQNRKVLKLLVEIGEKQRETALAGYSIENTPYKVLRSLLVTYHGVR